MKSNQVVETAKQILGKCEFTEEEIELVARGRTAKLQEIAETARTLYEKKIPKTQIMQKVLSDSYTSQGDVQQRIQENVWSTSSSFGGVSSGQRSGVMSDSSSQCRSTTSPSSLLTRGMSRERPMSRCSHKCSHLVLRQIKTSKL